MTIVDVENLFQLLKIYFPANQKVHSKKLQSAWHLLLEPYEPEVVKAALTDQLRENKNFPDAQAIATRCGGGREARRQPSTPLGAAEKRSLETLKSWQREWHQELHDKGLPTMREALESGLTLGQWRNMLELGGAWQ